MAAGRAGVVGVSLMRRNCLGVRPNERSVMVEVEKRNPPALHAKKNKRVLERISPGFPPWVYVEGNIEKSAIDARIPVK